MCLCDNIGLVALLLLGWELRASSITVLCVQAVMILSPLLFMPSLYSHSNSKNFYITCIHSTTVLCDMHSVPCPHSMTSKWKILQITKWGYRDGVKSKGDKIAMDYTHGAVR